MSANKLCWGAEAEIVMLDFYRDNDQLWDYKHQDYYDRDVRDRTLQELAIKLGHDYNGVPYTVNDIKYKIKNLRATFGRELMKCAVSRRNGQAHRYTPRWRHYHRMMFLRSSRKSRDMKNMTNEDESYSTDNEDHLDMFCDIEIEEDVEENERAINQDNATAADNETNNQSDVDESVLDVEERKNNLRAIVLAGSETSLDPTAFQSNDHLEIRRPTRKSTPAHRRQTSASATESSALDMVDYSINQTNNREDSEYHFCMSLAENLRKMSPYQRESAKIEMQKVMMRFMFPVFSKKHETEY